MTKKTYPFYFIVGALLIYTVLIVIPGIIGTFYSFTDWSSYSQSVHFVGLDNFKTIFSADQNYTLAIRNTLIFTVATIILKTSIGLVFALLLSEGIKLKGFHRAVLYMPAILSLLVTGLIFKSILNPVSGLFNEFLKAVGLGFLQPSWLTDPKLALGSIIGVDVWRGMGYIMTILLAGIQSIPKTYYEAADIDGATWWGRLRHITIPLLMPAITVSTVLNLFYGLKVFDVVYVLTNGGPGHVTEVVYTDVFKEFSQGSYGVGTALSTVLFIVMAIGGFFVIKLLNKEEVDA